METETPPGSHILAIYPNNEIKFRDAFEFLKVGLERNEVIMLITEDMKKDAIRDRMKREFKVDCLDLEARGEILIKSTSEWYFPDSSPDIRRTTQLWNNLAENSTKHGKIGVRVFGDVSEFFKRGFIQDLIKYESSLEPRFRIPLTAICAYDSQHVGTLKAREIRNLIDNHSHSRYFTEIE